MKFKRQAEFACLRACCSRCVPLYRAQLSLTTVYLTIYRRRRDKGTSVKNFARNRTLAIDEIDRRKCLGALNAFILEFLAKERREPPLLTDADVQSYTRVLVFASCLKRVGDSTFLSL